MVSGPVRSGHRARIFGSGKAQCISQLGYSTSPGGKGIGTTKMKPKEVESQAKPRRQRPGVTAEGQCGDGGLAGWNKPEGVRGEAGGKEEPN